MLHSRLAVLAGLTLVSFTVAATSTERGHSSGSTKLGPISERAAQVKEPRRFPDPTKVGLPEEGGPNSRMFEGLILTKEQGRTIVALAEQFRLERTSRHLGSPNRSWTREMKQGYLPFLERQRAAYRSVLKPEQRVLFDSNADRLMMRWLNASGGR